MITVQCPKCEASYEFGEDAQGTPVLCSFCQARFTVWPIPTGVNSPEAIIEAIRKAFAGVARGTVTLHEAVVIDDYGSDEDRRAARRLDTDDTWEEVPDDAIEQLPDALCFMDSESWRYYIPAYMVWALRNYRTSNSRSIDSAIYSFLRFNSLFPSLHDYDLLNRAQAVAVSRFLRYMARDQTGDPDSNAADRALDSYWGRFLSEWDAEQTDLP